MEKYIYNDGKRITSEEAHALKDKSKLSSSDKEIKKEVNKNERPNTNKRD